MPVAFAIYLSRLNVWIASCWFVVVVSQAGFTTGLSAVPVDLMVMLPHEMKSSDSVEMVR